ncbi:MAG: glutaredoxin family protein [Burkholderiaceae bacterium]
MKSGTQTRKGQALQFDPGPLGPRARLTLYGRGYCHLCDDMLAALAPLGDDMAFDVEVIDVDRHPDLESRLGELVPVLMLGDIEICHYFFNEDRLREVLSAIR